MSSGVLQSVSVFFSIFTMTSSAMTYYKHVMMTNPAGAQVCSTDPPTQVLVNFFGGKMRCGTKCGTSLCDYFQFKSTPQEQCEIYANLPVNFTPMNQCVGYKRTGMSNILLMYTNNIRRGTIGHRAGVDNKIKLPGKARNLMEERRVFKRMRKRDHARGYSKTPQLHMPIVREKCQ